MHVFKLNVDILNIFNVFVFSPIILVPKNFLKNIGTELFYLLK